MKLVVEKCPDYLVGSLFFIATWLILYWRAPASRKAMLWASITLLPFGPVLESIYVMDYWDPEHLFYVEFFGWLRVSLEDLIFTFTCVGICAALFDIAHRRRHRREITQVSRQSYWRLVGAGGLCMGVILLVWFWGLDHRVRALHSVNAHVIGCLVAFPIVIARRGWRIAAHAAALVGAVYMVIFYAAYYTRFYPTIFTRWWMEGHLSGHHIFGIPIEEIYWMAVTVLFIGPMVRFCLDHTRKNDWKFGRECRAWKKLRGARKKRPSS